MKRLFKTVKDILKVLFIVIDLFCGAGGTTTGFARTNGVALVIACINHDANAIVSHWENHPEVKHFEEDIRELNLTELVKLVNHSRKLYPNAKVVLWASLECTNFSKAKGGMARDADSRTLAQTLHMVWDAKKKEYRDGASYIQLLNPDFVMIENVVEFMAWGPLDENGKPVSSRNGEDWIRWRNEICDLGYTDEWKELNSADFGAYTSRNRLFGMFAREKNHIAWPHKTHFKSPPKVDDVRYNKWKAVKEVLDLHDEGKSVFEELKPMRPAAARKFLSQKKISKNKRGVQCSILRTVVALPKFIVSPNIGMNPKVVMTQGHYDQFDQIIAEFCANTGLKENEVAFYKFNRLSEKTHERVYAGLIKYVAGGEKAFIAKTFSGRPKGKVISLNGPSGAITAFPGQRLVNCSFITKYYTGKAEDMISDIDSPAATLRTKDSQAIVQPKFLIKYLSNDKKTGTNAGASIEQPAPTVTTQNRLGIVNPCFLTKYYGNGDNVESVESPAGTISTKDRFAKVQPIWLDKNYSGTANHQSIDSPAGTILSKDKYSIVNTIWMDRNFNNGGGNQSVEHPAGSITGIPKLNLVHAQRFILDTNYNNNARSIDEPAPVITASRRHHYLVNPQWGTSGSGISIDRPCFTLIARMDKAPPYIVNFETGEIGIEVYTNDSPCMTKMKYFMALYGIIDIKMRMLKIVELLDIQGFPKGYILKGTQTEQKKYIGNSVVPQVVTNWTFALANNMLLKAA